MGDIALKVVLTECGRWGGPQLGHPKAGSAYVAFLDADDEWLPEKLERSFDVLNGAGLDLVSHNYDAIAPDGLSPRRLRGQIPRRPGPVRNTLPQGLSFDVDADYSP